LRAPAAFLALLVLVSTGCGSAPATPESVVRSWSRALNAGDNDRAAALFAPGAAIVQGRVELHVANRGQAVDWNRSLPCSGRIVDLRARGETVTATFVLGDRPASRCDAPGEEASAVFRVHRGKIVLWHQVPVSAGGAPAGPVV
jgi:hypothetical protein